MNLRAQKEMAARALDVPTDRVKFVFKSDEDKDKVKNSITRQDIRELVEEGVVKKLPKRGISRTRANYIRNQKRKGRRSGYGSRRGTKNARYKKKRKWIDKIRSLRKCLRELRDEGRITQETFRELYLKSGDNFFRNKRHLLLYIEQHEMFVKNGKEQE